MKKLSDEQLGAIDLAEYQQASADQSPDGIEMEAEPNKILATQTSQSQHGRKRTILLKSLMRRDADPDEATHDPLCDCFKELLSVHDKVFIQFKSTEDLQEEFQHFVNGSESSDSSSNAYDALETLQDRFNQWKQTHNLVTLTNADFEHDRTHSLDINESVIQRTVLMSILDRWRMNRRFAFKCESE